MNPDDYTLAELLRGCEQALVQHSDNIQSFGCLLRLDAQGVITHVSANVGDFLPLDGPPEGVLGQPVTTLDATLAEELERNPHRHLEVRIAGRRLDLSVHASDDGRLIEVVPSMALDALPENGIEYAILQTQGERQRLEELMEDLTRTIRQITGFARVSLYRFTPEWDGEVVAEECDAHMPPYLGLRFPASDIPQPVRELYLRHPWRLVADVHAPAVALLSRQTDARLDLGTSDLRAVAPVHLEYLRNMGVGAAFSVAVVVQERLWGLVACHHGEARTLCYPVRRLCHFVVRGFVMRLLAIQAGERLKRVDSIDRTIDALTRNLITAQSPATCSDGLVSRLLRLVDAEGGFLVTAEGITPLHCDFSNDELCYLDEWFMGLDDELFHTDNLHQHCPWLKLPRERICGLLAVRTPYRKLDGQVTWLRFYWYRPEQLHEVRWAGMPAKQAAIEEESGTPYLSPRRSFAEWCELRRGISRPWSDAERLAATKFRGSVLRWLALH